MGDEEGRAFLDRLEAHLGGATHTAPREHHDEIILLGFTHAKFGEPIHTAVCSDHGFSARHTKSTLFDPPFLRARLHSLKHVHTAPRLLYTGIADICGASVF